MPSFSPRKTLVFSALATVLGLGILECVLALVGVEPSGRESDPWVGFADRIPLFLEAEPGRFVTAENRLRFFNPQELASPKPTGTRRLVCLGGSTTFGRPYDHRTAFCSWLGELLRTTRPGEKWETINAGGISYASYRVALVAEELAAHQPDVFVVYTGHNEFLEARTYASILRSPPWVRSAAALAGRSRAASLVARGLRTLTRADAEDSVRSTLEAEVKTRLDASVGPEDYERDPDLFDGTLAHFRHNLARIAELAEEAGAAVVFVTPASNIGDMSPFKSVPGNDDPEAEERWSAVLEESRTGLGEGDAVRVVSRLEDALDADPRHAAGWYWMGKAYEAVARPGDARQAYLRARDEDVCPLRAPGPFVDAVRSFATARDLPLVDFEAWCERRSPDGIPGRDLFLDHVHPTPETHRELALQVLAELESRGLVGIAPAPGEELLRDLTTRVLGRITPADRARALTNLARVFGWAGRLEEAHEAAGRASRLDPESADAWYHLGVTAQLVGRPREAVDPYVRAIRLGARTALVHGNLAAALEDLGEAEAALLHYRRAHELAPGQPQRAANLGAILERVSRSRERAGDARGARAARAERGLVRGDPTEADLAELGTARLALGDAAGAVPLLRAADASAHDDGVLHALVAALEATHRGDEARDRLDTAIAEVRGDVLSHRLVLGSLHLRRGRTAEAIAELETILDVRPRSVEAATNLAWILATTRDPGLRDPEAALRWGRRAVDASPGDPFALDALAAAEDASGRPSRAAALVEEGLRRWGDRDPAAATAMRHRLEAYRTRARGTATVSPAERGPSRGGSASKPL